mmetsp:Transcript_56693/g.165895  ORF Transcript_56693/g.165895 Transcript_56693/m.165895 type:complete len:297 (+) Transcript_56693:105-995(+)
MIRSAVNAIVLCILAHVSVAFDPADALMMARLEQAVYCGKSRFERWDVGDSIVHGPKVDRARLRYVEHNTTNAAAGIGRMEQPDGCFVALKGTTGAIDSLLDALFWLADFGRESCKGCQVTNGFFDYYESIKDGIFAALKEFGCFDQPLYLVGHSLGAAALTYHLYDLLAAGYQVKRMYALESPRPGNPAFANAVAAKARAAGVDAMRVAHFRDVVVHLPPRLLAYKHALPEIYFPKEKGTAYRECSVEDKSCANQWKPWQLSGGDHCWFDDLNPCGCSNETQTPPASTSAALLLI